MPESFSLIGFAREIGATVKVATPLFENLKDVKLGARSWAISKRKIREFVETGGLNGANAKEGRQVDGVGEDLTGTEGKGADLRPDEGSMPVGSKAEVIEFTPRTGKGKLAGGELR